jgi:anti-sigma-K factor RskA
MTHYEHIPFRENIPAYALGALDAEDVAALEIHLQTCASCRDELAAYRATSDNLLMSFPPQQPPAALRRRLQGQLPSAQKAVRPRLNWSFGRVAMGTAIVLLLVLNVFSISQVQALQRQQTQLMAQMQTGQAALAMLSYAKTQTYAINTENVSGSLLLDEEYNSAVLILRGLPPVADNQTYQVWLISSNGDRTSAGLLQPQVGQPFITEAIHPTQEFSSFIGMGMTVEPAGGSDHPTGKQIFRIEY